LVYTKGAVYVPPLFNTLPEFAERIGAAVAAAVTPAALTNRPELKICKQ
jgi:hypothetical protein